MDWFAGPMAPFTVALLVAAGLLVIEVLGALMGAMPSDMLEGALDFDADVDAEVGEPGVAGPLGWLGFGRVPALVILFSLLVAFGVSGVIIQWAAGLVLGGPLPGAIASAPALLAALPITRTLARGIARILPSEETEASSAAGFVGQVATLGAATARPGLPAEAKVTDGHGQTHYVRVVPEEEGELPAGSAVLLVTRQGGVFGAVPDPSGN